MQLISRSESKDQVLWVPVPQAPRLSSERPTVAPVQVGVGVQDGQWLKQSYLGQGGGVGQDGVIRHSSQSLQSVSTLAYSLG